MIIGVDFLGGRIDHELVCLAALAKFAARPAVLIGSDDVVFHCPPSLALDLPRGTRISFFPVMPCKGLGQTGLRWDIETLAFSATGRTGVSNEAIAPSISAQFDGPGMLAILPKAHLNAVVECLASAPDFPAK